jgi:L-threonylcarbamoyladenylate synthase
VTTEVLPVDADRPDPAAIERAAVALREGRLVAFPTETVYGLGADARNEDAVGRLFAVKDRPAGDPLIVHIAHIGQLGQVASEIPPPARALGLRFWAGPLTVIVPKRATIPDLVTAGLPTVAVRVPGHRVARALMEMARVPVAAPSANLFSRPSPTTARHVLDDFDGRIDLVLDGGPTPIGVESTIVDCSVTPPVLRRPGGIPIEAVRDVVPDLQLDERYSTAALPQPAPGQLLRHYAPRSPLTLYEGDFEAVRDRVIEDVRAVVASGGRAGILASEEDLACLAPIVGPEGAGRVALRSFGTRATPATLAKGLFAALRDLDRQALDRIVAIGPASTGLGLAVRDRLVRAAEGRVVRVRNP